MDFLSVNGLGGGMELGFVQEGHRLTFRTGSLTLGAPVVEGNRPVIGWDWDSQFTDDYREWRRPNVPVVMGNPPCSAWSTLTRKDLRGKDAKILKCTQEVIDYVTLLKTPPEIICLESVQQAFSTGRGFYQKLREQLDAAFGGTTRWDLIWVMQSNASLGGCSVRKRVFITYARIPFGVEYAQPHRVARLSDALRDLQGLDITMAKQPYRRPATWWSTPKRSEDGVDGHFTPAKLNDQYRQLWQQLDWAGLRWLPGESTTDALRKYHARYGTVPESWLRGIDKLLAKQFDLGMNQTTMWDPNKQSQVITGRGPHHSVHWAEPRTFTYRECARIQGFPDTWRIWPARDYIHIGSVWGKGVPVDAGRWIGKWIGDSLDGNRGTVQGNPIGDNERLIDVTNSYKHTLDVERLWEHQSWVPHEHGHWIDREHDAFCCA